MSSTRDAATWRVTTGTARGASHETRGLPNQDSVASRAIAAAGGVVVAVADGHGHGRHFRSATGSRLAVGTACAVVDAMVAEGHGPPWPADQAAVLRDRLPAAIVEQWRAAVAEDIEARPYTAGELAALEAADDGPEIPYGSTLLVALIAGDWLVCAQIGDGDLLAVRPDGRAWSPVDGDELLDGYRTTSLCQDSAVRSFRAAAHDLRAEPLLALLMSTDGYGNAQVSDPWQPSVASDLAELAATRDLDWFVRQVPVWAERCASAEGSGDDTTIGLLLAPDSGRLAASAARSAAPAGPASVTTPVPPRARPKAAAAPEPPAPPAAARSRPSHRVPRSAGAARRRLALAAAAVVVAAAAVAGALVITQSGGGQPQAPGRHPGDAPAGHASPSATFPVKPRDTGSAGPDGPSGTPTATRPAGGGAHNGGAGGVTAGPANDQEG